MSLRKKSSILNQVKILKDTLAATSHGAANIKDTMLFTMIIYMMWNYKNSIYNPQNFIAWSLSYKTSGITDRGIITRSN